MGHRTLVAYGQSDGTYTLRYAHWGDGLATAIGPEAPLGGRIDRTDGAPVADELGVDGPGGRDVPVWTGAEAIVRFQPAVGREDAIVPDVGRHELGSNVDHDAVGVLQRPGQQRVDTAVVVSAA